MTPSKISFGTQLPPDLVARLRAAVVNLQRNDPHMTIAAFTEYALTEALDGVESGKLPSPPTESGRPRPGRRIDARPGSAGA